MNDAIDLCKVGNFRLQKFVSTSKHLMYGIPGSEENPAVKYLFNGWSQRALGMEWTLARDWLAFASNLEEKPATRRGILSTVAQIWDRSGLLTPYTLMGKNISHKVKNSSQPGWRDTGGNATRIGKLSEWAASALSATDWAVFAAQEFWGSHTLRTPPLCRHKLQWNICMLLPKSGQPGAWHTL